MQVLHSVASVKGLSENFKEKRSEGGPVCAEKSRGKDYLKQFCSLYILDMQWITSLSALAPVLLQK